MNSPEPRATALHDILLRLAGWVPDDVMVAARDRLAERGFEEVVRVIDFFGSRTPLPLTDEDLVVLADVASNYPMSTKGTRDAADGAPPWRFTESVDDAAAVAVLPVADRFAAAVAREPAAHTLWQAWQTQENGGPYPPPYPVYVVEAADETDLPGLTGHLQDVLRATGEQVPRVEVVPLNGKLPVYQRAAKELGRLLWSAKARVMSVARVFDAVDQDTGPSFAPKHPLITDPAECDRLLAYLKQGVLVLATMGTLDDVVEPHRGPVVPMSYRTDGRWIWSEMVTYYLEVHQLAPDPELVHHIRGAGSPPDTLDTETTNRAIATIVGST
jgi:hypothetical protein